MSLSKLSEGYTPTKVAPPPQYRYIDNDTENRGSLVIVEKETPYYQR